MNEGKEFNHIKITPPQEEDVVIHAGASRSVDPTASADVGPDAAPIASDIASDEPAPIHAASPSVRDSSNADARSRSKKAAKQYKETTLEDIESSKMSTTQKVIIVIAILAVIAFAVYTAVNS